MFSFRNKNFSVPLFLSVTPVTFLASLGLAQGKVTKQQNCGILIQGLPAGASNVGQNFQISTADGQSLQGKIIKSSPKSAIGKIEKKDNKCPNLVGAEVSGGGSAAKGTTPHAVPPNATTGGSASGNSGSSSEGTTQGNSARSGNVFTRAQVGWTFITLQKEETDNKAQQLTGPQVALVGGYKLSMGPRMGIPFSLGVAYFSSSAKLQYQDEILGQTYDVEPNFSVVAVRVGTGFEMALGPVELLSEVNFDYGISSKFVVKESLTPSTSTYKVTSPYRIDLGLGVGYPMGRQILGVMGTFSMGGSKREVADLNGNKSSVSRSFSGMSVNGVWSMALGGP